MNSLTYAIEIKLNEELRLYIDVEAGRPVAAQLFDFSEDPDYPKVDQVCLDEPAPREPGLYTVTGPFQ